VKLRCLEQTRIHMVPLSTEAKDVKYMTCFYILWWYKNVGLSNRTVRHLLPNLLCASHPRRTCY